MCDLCFFKQLDCGIEEGVFWVTIASLATPKHSIFDASRVHPGHSLEEPWQGHLLVLVERDQCLVHWFM